jgi:hypothetical protein
VIHVDKIQKGRAQKSGENVYFEKAAEAGTKKHLRRFLKCADSLCESPTDKSHAQPQEQELSQIHSMN